MLRNPIFQGWGLSPSGSAHELSGMKRQFLLTHHFRSLRSRTRSQTCNINCFGSRKSTLQIQTINAPQFYQMEGDSQNSFFFNFQWVHKRPRYTVTKPKNRTGNSLFFLTTWRALDASRQRWACASNTVDFTVVSCADPGIFVMGGGGGGYRGLQAQLTEKKHSAW